MKDQMSMIRVEGLGKSFGKRTLWSGLEITVEPGQVGVLTGVSGSGKTTLLNCLSLLDRPTEGRIIYGDTVVSTLGRRARLRYRRNNIGYLLQDLALIENDTIAGNLRLARTPRRGRAARQADVLDRVGLPGRQKEKIYRLSGGEQQRVALAQLLLKKPSIILLDEPSSALDDTNTDTLLAIMKELATAGSAILISTHDTRIQNHADTKHTLEPCGQPGNSELSE